MSEVVKIKKKTGPKRTDGMTGKRYTVYLTVEHVEAIPGKMGKFIRDAIEEKLAKDGILPEISGNS